MHLKSLFLAAAVAASMIAPAAAIDILVEIQVTPEYTLRDPVAAVATVHGANQKDFYRGPTGTSVDDALAQNQCWTNSRKVRKTAGTQGAGGVCIVNGTLASTGGGTRPGTPYHPGLYVSGWAGLDIPEGTAWDDFSHKHDLLHPHYREE